MPDASPDPWTGPRRLDEPEQMDADGVDPQRLERALRFIRRINTLLGYTRTTLRHFDRLTADHPSGEPLAVLDVATGSADVPQALRRRNGRMVQITGLDLHAQTLAFAREQVGGQVALVRGDALRLPFADRSFDVVMTSMFLHHLPTNLVVPVLREMDRVARHAVIVADLVRDRAAFRWISLLTLGSDPLVRHDARVSVRQAFTLKEARQLAQEAGLEYVTLYPHRPYRFVLAGARKR